MIIERYNKKQFNKALVESVSEKPMLEDSSILAHRILPLNTIYGYFFITDEKVYFEPFHNLAGNAVDKIEISKIEKLFKRRYELREVFCFLMFRLVWKLLRTRATILPFITKPSETRCIRSCRREFLDNASKSTNLRTSR
jgi:hypothetical protein